MIEDTENLIKAIKKQDIETIRDIETEDQLDGGIGGRVFGMLQIGLKTDTSRKYSIIEKDNLTDFERLRKAINDVPRRLDIVNDK